MYFERIPSSGPSIKKFENEEAFNTYLENHPNTPAGTQFLIKDSNTVLYYNGTDAKTMTDVIVFDTKDDLDAYVADTTNTLNEGLIFLIKQAGESPYWWNGSELIALSPDLSDIATKTGVETLENKTLTDAKFTNNQFKTTDGKTITIPSSQADTLVTLIASQTLAYKTLTDAKFSSNRFKTTSGYTIMIPNSTDTLVGVATSQTLSNKILTGVKFTSNQFKTTGNYTITIPNTANATLATTDDVAAATANAGVSMDDVNTAIADAITTATEDMATKTGVETLENKTLTNAKFTNNQFKTIGNHTILFPDSDTTLATTNTEQTLSKKTLTNPKFTNNQFKTTDGYLITIPSGSAATLATIATSQTLSNKILTGVKFTSNQFKTTGNYTITIPNTANATLATKADLPAISSTDNYPTVETKVIDKSTSFINCTTVVMGAMKLVYIKATLNTALISSSDDTHIDLTLFPAGTFPAPKEDVNLYKSLAPTVAVINTVDLKADGSVYVAGYASSSETASITCSTFYVLDA